MTVLPNLERELLAAHQRGAGRRRHARVFPLSTARRGTGGWLAPAFAVAATVAIVAVFLIALRHGSSASHSVTTNGPATIVLDPIVSRPGDGLSASITTLERRVHDRASVRPGHQGRRPGRSAWRHGVESRLGSRSDAARASGLLRLGSQRPGAEWKDGREPTEVWRHDRDRPQPRIGERARNPGIRRSVAVRRGQARVHTTGVVAAAVTAVPIRGIRQHQGVRGPRMSSVEASAHGQPCYLAGPAPSCHGADPGAAARKRRRRTCPDRPARDHRPAGRRRRPLTTSGVR